MDDLKLVADNDTQIEYLVEAVDRFSEDIRIKIGNKLRWASFCFTRNRE